MRNNKSPQLIDQEEIYEFLKNENWKELLSFIWSNSDLIKSDEIIKHAIVTCENTFFSNISIEERKTSFINNLATFHALHDSGKYELSEVNYKNTILKLVALWKVNDLKEAYKFAKELPENELCKQIIKEYEDSLPKYVSHSQTEKIQLTKNRNIADIDARISLFKSNQEREFFYAVRESFPNYMVYPNVALSSILNFEKVKLNLSEKEKEYFFRAIIDCVVFDDQNQLLLPIFFYELDSIYHDTEKQKKKDLMKDKILASAGQELLRIRKLSNESNRKNFIKLVKEKAKEVI